MLSILAQPNILPFGLKQIYGIINFFQRNTVRAIAYECVELKHNTL